MPPTMPPLKLVLRTPPFFHSGCKTPHRQLRHTSTKQTPSTRISRLEARLPRFLTRYLRPLRNAPLSHITAFLILHELTAVVPLFGLTFAFHKLNWLPPFFAEGEWVKQGVEKFGGYFRRKGWIDDEGGKGIEAKKGMARWWPKGEVGVRVIVEVATAYAVTKALLPLRLGLSLWLTPAFARVSTLPLKKWMGRLVFKKTASTAAAAAAAVGKAKASPAAATNAVGGKAVK